MPYGAVTRFLRGAVVLLYAYATLACLKPVVALPPPPDAGEEKRDGDGTPNSLGSSSVAECVAEVIRAHRAGPPVVGVVFAAEGALLPRLMAALQRPPETPMLLLASGRRARRDPSPSAQPWLKRNMSHAVFLPSPEAPFHRLFEQATHDPHWSPATIHLVVASTAEAVESDGGAEVRAVLTLAWRHWVANIAVVVPAKEVNEQFDALISVITHFPYSSGGICGKDSPRIEEVAVWQGGRFTRGSAKDVYPDKFGDLHGCVVGVTVFDAPPACIPKVGRETISMECTLTMSAHFANRVDCKYGFYLPFFGNIFQTSPLAFRDDMLTAKGKGHREDEVEQIDGLHGLFMAEAAERMNFTPRFNQFFPQRYGNTSNPFWYVFPPLLEHRTDMVLCEVVLTPNRHRILGEGFHHQWSCSTFAVPVSHPGSSWRLIGLASPLAWMALLASVVLSCAASWVINKLQPNQLTIQRHQPSKVATDALVAFAGVTLQRPPMAPSSRALFPAVCLGGLIATTAIRAQLSSFLSAPDTTSWAPSNLEEMADSKIPVGGPMAFKFLAKGMMSKSWKAILRHYELHDEGTEALDIDGVAVAGMRRNLLYRLAKKSREKVVLKECPLPVPTVIFLRKGSPFQLELKKIDQGLVSGGIIAKWMEDHTSKTGSKRTAPKVIKSGSKRKISVSELSGVFIFYSLGLLASLVVFILEVAMVKLHAQELM